MTIMVVFLFRSLPELRYEDFIKADMRLGDYKWVNFEVILQSSIHVLKSCGHLSRKYELLKLIQMRK